MKTTTPTTLAEASGRDLRRATEEAVGGSLFSHRRRVTEGQPLAADFVPAVPDDDNDMSPPLKDGTTAKTPFKCLTCSATAILHRTPRYCLKCGEPVRPVESVATDPRRVNESDDDVTAKLEGLN